jgi:hypothetical protein
MYGENASEIPLIGGYAVHTVDEMTIIAPNPFAISFVVGRV